MKTSIITGITGQDGSYLAEQLLARGGIVHGIIRRSSSFNTNRIDHLISDEKILNKRLFLHFGDLTDSASLSSIVSEVEPDYIFNLAAQSHVKVSFELPDYTAQVDALGTLRLLEIIKNLKKNINIKLYQASTSELYGEVLEVPQTEKTFFNPTSPYAIAKQYAFWMCKNYRDSYDIFAANGILFNHESPRRGKTFVTSKIVNSLAKIKLGNQTPLTLGNIYAKRDWGYAPEYTEGMIKIIEQESAEDFVLATGKTYTIKNFVDLCLKFLEINFEWTGQGVNEECIDKHSGKTIVKISKEYFRPSEVNLLIGDSSKAKKILGWEAKTNIDGLIEIMMSSALADLKND
ncbi:GDP-mannose 4,6-dehydratase [bacterium]|nr:GDP-mannose 4,6-dehydratase [bacterium]MDA7660300.1 GDP-mannose 4,6-dehydratase [Verrucomicrobiota bacterium]